MFESFPKSKTEFLKAEEFQDNEKLVTYLGWEKKANEDKEAKGKFPGSKWASTLKYCLKYTYPEFATDPMTGEKRLDKNGEPFRNMNYDPLYPHGYSVIYHFEEGVFESGSSPLFKAFTARQPKPGDKLLISRTGAKEETKWFVKKASSVFKEEFPSRDVNDFPKEKNELEPDEEVPF